MHADILDSNFSINQKFEINCGSKLSELSISPVEFVFSIGPVDKFEIKLEFEVLFRSAKGKAD